MSRYTVVIKNKLENEKSVARIKTFGTNFEASMFSKMLNNDIDNDIYYADLEEEEADEEDEWQ